MERSERGPWEVYWDQVFSAAREEVSRDQRRRGRGRSQWEPTSLVWRVRALAWMHHRTSQSPHLNEDARCGCQDLINPSLVHLLNAHSLAYSGAYL